MALSSVQSNALESVYSDEYQEQLAREWRNGTVTIDLPVYTNTVAIKDGGELLLPRQKTQPKESNRTKTASAWWDSEYTREMIAAQKTSSRQLTEQPTI